MAAADHRVARRGPGGDRGEIPADLDGVYLRNTENPVHPALERYHPFDGDGMVHVVGFRDGKAFYRNRFIRTDGLLAEREAGKPLWAGLAERPASSPRQDGWGARGRMKDASSTDVMVHAGVALTSFYQCGDLYRLDPLTLETLGKAEWGGAFPYDCGVSAHTKTDPRTGELLFFNYGTGEPYMHYGVVDADDRLSHYVEVPLPGPRLPHDMAFTENYAILNDCPLFWEPELMAKGLYAARFHPELPTRLAVVPRRGGGLADPVVRGRSHLRPALGQRLRGGRRDRPGRVLPGFPEPGDTGEGGLYQRMFRFLALDRMQTRLHRWRLNLVTGRCAEERLTDSVTEFGVLNNAYGGRRHRYAYAATGLEGWFLFDGLVRHDLLTGTEERFGLPTGVYGSEPAMAPRVGSSAEDDGYLVTLTTDMNEDRSECLIFDAAGVADGPLARLRLPERISSGTHATWAAGESIPAGATPSHPPTLCGYDVAPGEPDRIRMTAPYPRGS
ncbi:carotenoid oxygenase family protein [Streptosporangium lutulentum]